MHRRNRGTCLLSISSILLIQSLIFILTWSKRLNVPDTLCVFLNTPVTGEESHTGHSLNRLADPALLVLVCLVDELLGADVGVEIVRDQIIVAVGLDGTDQSGEGTDVAKGVGLDAVEDGLELWINRWSVVRMCVAQVLDVFRQVTEEEDVVLADLAGDFDLHDILAMTLSLTSLIEERWKDGKEWRYLR